MNNRHKLGPEPPSRAEIGIEQARTARLARWRYIVVHHSDAENGNAEIFDEWHHKVGFGGLAYHFVIGNGHGLRDGQIEVGYRWIRQQGCAHSGRAEYNHTGIAICLVGDLDRHPPTAKQMEALRRLTVWLMRQTGIPSDRILRHQDVKDTDCPGKQFPFKDFVAWANAAHVQPEAREIPAASILVTVYNPGVKAPRRPAAQARVRMKS